MDTDYTAAATAIGGREGFVASADGILRLRLSNPGHSDRNANPEQLFAAAYAACFLESLRSAAAEVGEFIDDDASVTVTVALRSGSLAAAVAIDLPRQDRAAAEDLARRAHARCPYSRALHEELVVDVSVP